MREEFGTPRVVRNPPRWRFPRWESLVDVDSGLEILHGGVGGDVEQGARTSKHIFVFAFDPIVSQLYSLYICASIIHFIKALFFHSILYTLLVLPLHNSYCYILDCLA